MYTHTTYIQALASRQRVEHRVRDEARFVAVNHGTSPV